MCLSVKGLVYFLEGSLGGLVMKVVLLRVNCLALDFNFSWALVECGVWMDLFGSDLGYKIGDVNCEGW